MVAKVTSVADRVRALSGGVARRRFHAAVIKRSQDGAIDAFGCAGGIGLVLWDVIRAFQYAQTAAVLLMLVVSVSLIDLVSARCGAC